MFLRYHVFWQIADMTISTYVNSINYLANGLRERRRICREGEARLGERRNSGDLIDDIENLNN